MAYFKALRGTILQDSPETSKFVPAGRIFLAVSSHYASTCVSRPSAKALACSVRSSALAQALRDYASPAKSLETRLLEVDSDFDPDLIREAHELADRLSLQPTEAAPTSAAVRTATTTRNRLLRLLMNKVAAVRKTSAHVFRRHPEIARQATSACLRRRSAARRNKAAREAEAAREEGEAKAGDP